LCLLREEDRLRVFENRVLSREVSWEWRGMYSEELHDLNSSPNIRMTKSRIMRWAGYVARIGEVSAYRNLAGTMKVRVRLEEEGGNGRAVLTILRRIIRK
jgi:hypothetical protein